MAEAIIPALVGPEVAAVLAAEIVPGLTYGGVLSQIIVTGTLTGLSILLTPKPKSKPSEGSFPFKQPIPERIYGVGDVRIGGKTLFLEEMGTFLHSVTALCDGETDRLAYYFHDDLIELDASGNVLKTPDGKYAWDRGATTDHFALVKTAYGVAGVMPFAELDAAFTEVDATFCGTGITMLYMRLASPDADEFTAVFPSGKPEPSAVVRFKRRFDPRDPLQNPNNPATWSADSKNVAINWLYYECFCPNGPRRNYATDIAPYFLIWKQALDDCDELVPSKFGGDRPRYEIGYFWDASAAEDAVRSMFIACCDGWAANLPGGGFIIRVGVFHEPEVVIDDRMLVGAYIQRDQAIEDRVNELVLKYTSPQHDYGEVEADPFRDEAQILSDGRVLNATIDLWGVQNLNQVRRLGHVEWNRQNEPLRGRLDLNELGLVVLGHRFVRVQSSVLPRLADTVIELRGGTLDVVEGTISVDFIGSGANTYAHNPNDATLGDGNLPAQPTRPDSEFLIEPQNVEGAYVVITPGSQVRLDLSWNNEGLSGYSYSGRWRVTGGTTWTTISLPPTSITPSRISAQILPTVFASSYDVQVRAIVAGGTATNFAPDPPLVVAAVPANAILTEDAAPLLTEAGGYLVTET